MATAVASLPAHALLDLLQPSGGQPPPSDLEADTAVRNFVAHLNAVAATQRQRPWSERYLIDEVFSRSRTRKNDHEAGAYARCHLKVAIDRLSRLINDIEDTTTGLVTADAASKWSRYLIDYVFDLQDIVPYLQRKVSGYEYLRGGKNPHVHSWELYRLANDLARQSAYSGTSFDHKQAQIASIGVLRQAMELRFDRLIAVYPRDRKGRSPKLRHGFHHDFVADHPAFFQLKGFQITDLRPVYDWCSEIVHQAYQPYAWQIDWALELAGRLLQPRAPASPGGAWSIANTVEILDVGAMQATFERHFLETYEHGEWQMTRHKPEALVPGWEHTMSFTATAFVPVTRRPSFWQRLRRRWRTFVAKFR